MKKFVQFVGSVLYTIIFGVIVYYATTLPAAWVLSLPTFWKIVVVLFLFSLIAALVSAVLTIALAPYRWLLLENKGALYVSIGLFVINVISNCIAIWKANLAVGGFWAILFAIIVTAMLIFIVSASTEIMRRAYTGEF